MARYNAANREKSSPWHLDWWGDADVRAARARWIAVDAAHATAEMARLAEIDRLADYIGVVK